MKSSNIHAAIATEAIRENPDEDCALALMILLHTHHIFLQRPLLEDRPTVLELAAITQRHAAEVIASAWSDRTDSQRTISSYWYYQFNTRTPFETLDDVPSDWASRIESMRQCVIRNPIVKRLEPED